MYRVFSIEYNKETEILHVLSVPWPWFIHKRSLGLTFNAANDLFGEFLFEWEPPFDQFEDLHDITTTNDGHFIYTGELDGRIDKFQL
jgi:hypothetical protein